MTQPHTPNSGQDHRTTNHNSRKTSKEQEIYTRGSGHLRKSAEPEFASIMTSFDEPRITNENNDLNPEQKKTRKPDSPLYAVKGSTERDSSYRDRDNNRHGRGGRDHYSSNSQHRNLFTNNNRNKHKREFDNEKKTDPGTNVKPSVDDNSNPITNKGPPPVINHRSAILSQSTKSYERNVNNGPASSVENGTVVAPTELGRDHARNNYRNNRNNQFDNRRNNDNYDRGRGGRHYNRRDRDDRHHYDDHGAGGRYNRHGSNVDLTASTETLSHQSGRRYRGSQSDLARGQRGHWGQDNNNRGRNNRYRDSDRQNEAEDRRKDGESLQYNRPRHTTEQSATEDPYIGDTTSNVPNDTAPNIEYELSEQIGAVDLNETSQQRTPEEPTEGNNEQDTSDLVLIDPSQINSDYFSWSNVEDWSKGVDDDVWGSSVPSTSEQQELARDPSPPLPPVDTSIPPPAPHTQDDKDWGSIRSKPQEDTSWRQSNNNNNSNNWSRDQRDNRSYSNEYNDRYGEPKKKPFNSNNSPSPGGRGFTGGRGGKGQFSGSYWDLPPRLRKQREEQHQQQQQRSNQQPPSPYPRGQGHPSPRDASYHSLGTHSDGNWKGESMEIRGNPHRHQDNRHYNSLPPPSRGRQDDGAPRGDFNRDRRFSTYDTDSTPRADYVHNSIDQTPPQSLPNPPALNNTDQTSGSNTTFSWVDDVEENEGKLEKLEKVKSAFQVPDPPAGGRGGGRGGFHGGRGGFNGGRGRDNRRDHHHEKLDSRSSSRSSRRRRKSGSSVGSRRRSHSRDTVDTNISSTTTGTTRSRKNSDRSAASDKNWRDRAPQYEHSRSSEVTNWRDRGNSSSSSQDWKSLRSGGRAPNESLSWRQPPPQISEEPPARQGGESLPLSSHGGIIRIPSQDHHLSNHPRDYPNSRDYPHPNQNSREYPYPNTRANPNARTPLLFNPHNPSNPIPVHSSHSRPSAAQTSADKSKRYEHLMINGVPLKPPEGHYGSAVPKHWYSKKMLSGGDIGKQLYVLVTANNEISDILNQSELSDSELMRLNALRKSIKEILVWFVRNQIRFCQIENVESSLWKLAFYNVIEALKNYPVQNPELRGYTPVYHKLLNDIIDDGIVYFESVLTALEAKFKFKLEDYFNKDGCALKSLLGFALQSSLKICIFLGDLCRYKSTHNGSNNFTRATTWYLKANALNPRNGRPYNQLGLIAFNERRQLEAIYYSTRSLLTNTPMRSVYERLIMVFDENRKLYETAYASSNDQQRIRDSKRKETREYRREIWIHPEDNRSTARNQLIHDSDSEMEVEAMEKLTALSHVDLSKQFTCSFLLVHGKLFSKTGLESLPLISKQMLREFKLLLAQNGLSSKKLLQLLSINMFSIERTQLKDSSLGDDYKSLTQELALIVSLEMFYCLVHQCNVLLSEGHPLSSDHFANIFPAVKIWTDWFVCQTNVWNPPPSTSDYHIGSRDVWTELALLMNNLLGVPCDHSVLVPPESDELKVTGEGRMRNDFRRIPNEFVEVRLAEDVMFFQYPPLASISNIQDPVYTRVSNDMESVHSALRLRTVLFFGTEFLVGIDPPVLELHKTDTGRDEYVSVVEIVSKGESEEESGDDKNNLDWDEEIEEAIESENPLPEATISSEYQELLEKRLILNKLEEQSELKKRILESHRKFRVQLEIKPHYLVPDTNCFIDYLPELKSLVVKKTAQTSDVIKRNLFTILIPCIVYNELCNIAKSSKKAAQVVRNAQLALKYIQSETRIKYVTTKGTFLSKSMFSMEEDDDLLKNDDKILETCLSLARKKSRKPAEPVSSVDVTNAGPNADGLEIIFRDLVLLTEDRNLRLKALARDVPVTSVTYFVKWCNVRQSAG